MSNIELKNIYKTVIDKKKKIATYVLYDVSCNFYDNKINVILGSSGAGKTFLLKCIAGIENIDKGSIFSNGDDITNVLPQKRNMAYMSQNLALYPHMTVFENIAYPLKIMKIDGDEIRYRVNEILSLLNLTDIKNRKIKEISSGQAQRVCIGKCLIRRIDVLLLDEPFSALDERLKKALLIEIKELQTKLNLTIIYVTHNLSDASIMGDYITIIDNGSIIETGEKKSLLMNKESYLYKNFINITDGDNNGF